MRGKGLRNKRDEYSFVKVSERPPEAWKNMFETGPEAMIGAVERLMNGVSNGIQSAGKKRIGEEVKKEDRSKNIEERI